MAGTNRGEGDVAAEINITPLADVMLVLLIIFMITAPLSSHQIKVTLPKANPPTQKVLAPAPPIDLAVQANGTLYWNDSPVDLTQLKNKLVRSAEANPQPPLKIRADKSTRYKIIRQVLETAKAAGIVHIEFVTEAMPNA